MKQYPTIRSLYMSFYSKSFYKDVARNWNSTGFLYLFLLVLLCIIPMMFSFQEAVSAFVADEAPGIVRQVPEIKITKGKISIDKPMPYIIKDPDKSETLIIIDTTGKITSLDGSPATILITESKIIMKKSLVETRTFNLSEIDNFYLDRSMVYKFLDIINDWLTVLVFPFALIFSFLCRILQVLLYSVFGLLFAHILKTGINYKTLVRLTAISITPAVIFGTVRDYLHISVPYWSWISFLIAMSYLFFALKVSSEKETA